MKYKSNRIKNLIIKEIMSSIATGVIKDPRVPHIMSITRITLSKDLHYCHLYFTMFGDENERKKAILGLNSSKGFFQRIIAKNLDLRFTPVIEFRYDEQDEKAYEVEKILEKLAHEREENKLQNNDIKIDENIE